MTNNKMKGGKKTFNKNKKKNVSILREIEDIYHTEGLTPENVVKRASDPKNVLHSRFQWDDTIAAREWRLQQARILVNEFTVVVEGDCRPKFENIMVKVISESGDTFLRREYKERKDILRNADWRQQILNEAMEVLKYWQSKYQDYKNSYMSPVFLAIDKVAKKHDKASSKNRKKRTTSSSK